MLAVDICAYLWQTADSRLQTEAKMCAVLSLPVYTFVGPSIVQNRIVQRAHQTVAPT